MFIRFEFVKTPRHQCQPRVKNVGKINARVEIGAIKDLRISYFCGCNTLTASRGRQK